VSRATKPGLDEFVAQERGADFLRQQNTRLQAQLARTQTAQAENALLRVQLAQKDAELGALLGLQKPVDTYVIKPTAGKRVGEAMPWLIASDTHIEEFVASEMVNGLNYYDLSVSKRRFDRFFTRGHALIEMIRRDVAMPKVGLMLGGDMITGSIHEDLAEGNLLPPVDAAMRCAEYICSGIEFLLRETKPRGTTIDVFAMTGNHGRMTQKQRIATEPGYSIERLLYKVCAEKFNGNPRVKFNIASSYHTFVQVYGTTLRLHHGHNIKYGGGVGGITIPTLKAIAQWQTSRRADFDIFGHFHQFMRHKRFVSNGSLIGWSPYAIAIKAEYEPPQQTLVVIDKKRGITFVEPIFVDEGEERLVA
jgi:hypothetical protein